jgi:hypothetical protein
VGPNQLKALLLKKGGDFRRAFSEKMLTYALGRGLTEEDRCVLDGISADVAKQDNRFSSLIIAVVQSEPFRKRRAEPLTKPATTKPATNKSPVAKPAMKQASAKKASAIKAAAKPKISSTRGDMS